MKKVQIITLTLSLFFVIGCVNNSIKNEKFKKVVESFTNKENNFTNTINRLSEDYIFSELSKVKSNLKELRSVHFDNLLKEEKVDYKFIESLLVGKELDYEEVQSWKRRRVQQESSNIEAGVEPNGVHKRKCLRGINEWNEITKRTKYTNKIRVPVRCLQPKDMSLSPPAARKRAGNA